MKRHYVPPNYDSSPFTLLGFFKLSAIFESLILAAALYYTLKELLVFIPNQIIKVSITIALSCLVFVFCMALSGRESLSELTYKWLRYRHRRRKLRFRRINRRVRIETKRTLLPAKEKYTQEYLKTAEFSDGVIRLEDDRYVKILEIEAVNFAGLKPEEIGAILQDFARLLKTGPINVQLKVISKRSDLTGYINNLLNKADKKVKIRELVRDVIDQLKDLSKDTTLEHRYFYIFSYKSENTESTKEDILKEIKTQEELIRSYLGKRGVKVKAFDDLTYDLFNVEFLYEFYNRRSAAAENYLKRRERVLADTKRFREVDSENPLNLKNVIAPRGLDFSNPDYILMDGLYYSYLTIVDYPDKGVSTGWLGKFINIGEGFDFDVLIERVDKKSIRQKLKKRNLLTKTNADQMNAYSSVLSETKEIIRATDYLLSRLEGDSEFFYVTVICTVVAETYAGLRKKIRWVKDLFDGYSFKVEEPRFELEDAFYVTNPLCLRKEGFLKKYHRNLVTDDLTGFYPYTTASISQIDGIAIGVNEENHSPLLLDVFNPVSNMFVFGTTGYGKSFLSMLIATRLRLMQTQVYVIAPIKAHEYRKITECVGGSFIEIGPGSKHCINILEVRPMYRYERRDNEEEGVFTESSYLNEKIQDLLVFFSLITDGTITREARDLLSPFLVSFYKGFGITDDNASIYTDKTKRELVKMPILSDLYRALLGSEEEALRELAIPLKKFTEGNLKYFDNQTNVDLDNNFCVIDMSSAIDYDETRELVIYLIQNYVWSRVRADRSHRKAIIYEEIWKMLNTRESAETIREVFKTIRGFYGIAVGITQNLEDLTNNSFGVADGILNNTLIQIILHNSSDEATKIKNRFGLSDYEYGEITGLDKGESLIITPEEHYKCRILATETEARLFETDGNKLNAKKRDAKTTRGIKN